MAQQISVKIDSPRPVVSTDEVWDSDLLTFQKSIDRLRAQRAQMETLKMQTSVKDHTIEAYEKENHQLKKKLKDLQDLEYKNAELRDLLSSNQQRCVAAENVLDQKRKEIIKAQEMHTSTETELRHTIQKLTVEVEELRSANMHRQSNLEDTLRMLEIQLDTEKRHADMAKSQMLDMENSAKVTVSSIESQRIRAEKDLVQQLIVSRTLLNQAQADAKKLELQVQSLLKTTTRQTAIIHECDDLLTQTRKEVEQLTEAHRVQVEENRFLQDQLSYVESQDARKTIEMESELRLLKSKKKEKETRIVDQQKIIERLEAEKHELSDKHGKICAELQERIQLAVKSDQEASRWLESNRNLVTDNERLKMKIEELNDQNSILESKVNTLIDQIENERKDRSKWAAARFKLLAQCCDNPTAMDG